MPNPALANAARPALCLVLLLIVAKAASADITWDESWTFLHYGRPTFGFLRLDYANNHVLNSIAIHVATSIFGSSVFVIRLPNVLAGLLYLVSVAIVIRHVEARALAFAILVLNPYLVEHFALARGYGLAAAILGFGLARGVFAQDWRQGYAPLLALAVLASFAIASDITIVAGLVVSRALVAIRGPEGLRARWIVPSALACLGSVLPFLILLQETRPGVPVFGSASGPFGAIAAGVARMFVADRAAVPVALVVLIGLSCLLGARWRSLSARTWFLLLASFGEFAVVEAGALLFGKKLPTGRLLVPSLPLWGCALVSWSEDLGAGRSIRGAALSGVIVVVLGTVFLGRWHSERFLDWPEDAGLEARLVRAVAARRSCLPWDVWARYGHEYYLDRWFDGRGGPADLPCSRPR